MKFLKGLVKWMLIIGAAVTFLLYAVQYGAKEERAKGVVPNTYSAPRAPTAAIVAVVPQVAATAVAKGAEVVSSVAQTGASVASTAVAPAPTSNAPAIKIDAQVPVAPVSANITPWPTVARQATALPTPTPGRRHGIDDAPAAGVLPTSAISQTVAAAPTVDVFTVVREKQAAAAAKTTSPAAAAGGGVLGGLLGGESNEASGIKVTIPIDKVTGRSMDVRVDIAAGQVVKDLKGVAIGNNKQIDFTPRPGEFVTVSGLEGLATYQVTVRGQNDDGSPVNGPTLTVRTPVAQPTTLQKVWNVGWKVVVALVVLLVVLVIAFWPRVQLLLLTLQAARAARRAGP